VANRCMSLPIYPELTDNMVTQVTDVFKSAL